MSADREMTLIDHVEELSIHEMLEEGQKLAEIEERISVAKAALKTITADHKARITEIERDRTAISRVIRTKQRELVTECYADPDYSAGFMVFSSVETGQVVLQRALTNEERQMKIIDMENSASSGVNVEGMVEELMDDKSYTQAASTPELDLAQAIAALDTMNYLKLKGRAKGLGLKNWENLEVEELKCVIADALRLNHTEDLSRLGEEA